MFLVGFTTELYYDARPMNVKFETFLIIRRNERNLIINVHCSLSKLPVIIVNILIKLKSSRQIFEK